MRRNKVGNRSVIVDSWVGINYISDMTELQIRDIISKGEGPTVEFKRCGNGIETDTYEAVCSFSNRFGGEILCGVLDDGTVSGVQEAKASEMVKNFISVCANPNMFSPTLVIEPSIVPFDGKTIIHIHVPVSAEVHTFKKVVYDRSYDSDVKVSSTHLIAEMYIRKMSIFTERKIYRYVEIGDLRPDLISHCKKVAGIRRPDHPWENMDDFTFLKSARLYGIDPETGERGLNLAAVLLLGKDDVIGSVCPAYKTDAIYRKVNSDRYDDRQIVKTNLIESYRALMDFGRKHLDDKFHLEEDVRVSIRDRILRELASNTLIHREYSSPFSARFIIERNKMYTENANRAAMQGDITPDTMIPVSKNPIIASVFESIGLADELGSGTRRLFHYARLYSGNKPTMHEDTIFRTTIPLDDSYSYDVHLDRMFEMYLGEDSPAFLTTNQRKIIDAMKADPTVSAQRLAPIVGISTRKIEENIRTLRESGVLRREGSNRSGFWVVDKRY